MNASKMFLLGAAAGAGITLFLTSDKGKQIIKELQDQYVDKLLQLSGALKNDVDESDNALKNEIDKLTNKLTG